MKLGCYFFALLSILISSAEADAPATQPADDTQILAVLQDLPSLGGLVQKDNAIWKWLETAFAFGSPDFKIIWRAGPTDDSFPTGSQSSSYPDFKHVVTITVDGTFKEGPSIGKVRPAEDMLANLVYELNNSRHVLEKGRLTRLAETGGISRDDFIEETCRQEYLAAGETEDFYYAVWQPFCKEKGLPLNPRLWQVPVENIFAERLAKYPRSFWYPWGYFGQIYERRQANAEDDFRFGALAPLAMKLLPAKAAAGDADAEEKMGVAYLNGYTVAQDYAQAIAWLSKAAAQGNAVAEKHLAWMYDNGVGVALDRAVATSWYLKAAMAGDATSEDFVAERLGDEAKTPQDLAAVLEWYRKSALQGNSDAQDHYGYALLTGKGTEKNVEKGFIYLLSAAERKGHARLAVAECYAQGIFVKPDPVEAYRWCLGALEIDKKAAERAAQLAAKLTPEQVAQAKKEAADYDRYVKDRDLQTDALSLTFAGDAPVTVPFDYAGHCVLVPIQVEDGKTKYLVVDTGSDVTLLSPETAAGLNCNANQYVVMGGNGADLKLTNKANGLHFSLGGLTVSGANALVLDDFDLDQYVGHPLAGVLGYDILSHLVVTIDYVNKKITFQKPGSFKPDAASEAVPLFCIWNSPFIQISIGAEDHAAQGWFLVDTGDGETISISRAFQDANPQVTVEPSVQTGALGLGGLFYQKTGRCDRINIGGLEVWQPIIALDLEKIGRWTNLRGGAMGDGLLHRFDTTFDGPEGKLYLKRNAQSAEPFTYNNVGMGVKTAKGDYHSFLIYGIVPGGPADLAKLQVGDQITAVDQLNLATLTLDDVHDAVKKPGVHHFTISRKGATITCDLNVVETIK